MMVKIQKFVMMLVLGMMVVAPMVADAQFSVDTKARQGAANQTGDVAALINKAIGFVLSFVFGLSVLMIVVAGVMYIISAGDDAKVENAKKWLTYAVVGLIVALLGYAIVYAVSNFLITK